MTFVSGLFMFLWMLCTCHPEEREGTTFWDSKIVLRTTKVPHLLKGRFRDDICFRFNVNFLNASLFPLTPKKHPQPNFLF